MNTTLKKTTIALGVVLTLAAATFLAHSSSLKNGFYFDDSHVVTGNLAIRSLKNIPRFFHDISTFSSDVNNWTYRPVVTLSLALNYAVGGLAPFGYHATHLGIHLACGILLFLIVKRLFVMWTRAGAGGSMAVALAASVLFLVAPMNVETLNYASCRSSSLATLFYLLGFLLYLRARTRGWLWYAPVVVCMTLSLMSKDIAASFPLLLLLFEYWDREFVSADGRRRWWLWPMIFFALIVALYSFRAFFLLGVSRTQQAFAGGDFLVMVGTQSRAHVHYIRQFLFPTEFPIDAIGFGFTSVTDLRSALSVFTLMGVCLFIFLARKKLPALTFGLLWYFVALSPSSSIAFTTQPINYHRPYIALPGLCCAAAALAWVVWEYCSERFARKFVVVGLAWLAVCALGWYVILSREQNKVWADKKELWTIAVRHSPRSGRAQMNLGLQFMRGGQYDDAEKHFTECLRVWPYYAYAHVNLGVLYKARGDMKKADKYFREAHRMWPRHPVMMRYLADHLLATRRYAEAIEQLNEFISDKPESTPFRKRRGTAYFKIGKYADAVNDLLPARAVLTDDKDLIETLGLSLINLGRYEEAYGVYDEWLLQRPGDAHALFNRAYSSQCMGKYERALREWDELLKVTPDSGRGRNNRDFVLKKIAEEP